MSAWLGAQKRIAITSVAALLVGILIWQLFVATPISASELLDKSQDFHAARISGVANPVVYQKLKVTRNGVSEIQWEAWRDTTLSRSKRTITASVNAGFDQELSNVMQANSFESQEPMSASTFTNWRKSLGSKNDVVSYETSEQGGKLITLSTTNLLASTSGSIRAATLKLRSDDFHPVGQILLVNGPDGIYTYEFAELEFQILSLNALSPGFFDDPSQTHTASIENKATAKPIETNSNTANSNVNAIDKPPVASFTPASVDLEIEIVQLLNKVKADLGEQITVSRDGNGRLIVRGLVDSPKRKNEISEALLPVQNNPSVRIDLRTIEEAVAVQKSAPTKTDTPVTIESQTSTTATDAELLSYFKSKDAALQFGGQMIARSNRAMSRAYALKRLVGQFKPEEIRSLSPDAREKLLRVVRSHAGALQDECSGLRGDLQPIFGVGGAGNISIPKVEDLSTIANAVDTLVRLTSTNDRVIRSAFALSANESGFTAIRTAQFWQSLKAAESLAGRLQSIR